MTSSSKYLRNLDCIDISYDKNKISFTILQKDYEYYKLKSPTI